KTGIIRLQRLVEWMCLNPRRIFGLEVEGEANLAIFDLKKNWTVDSSKFASMGKATPFDGMSLTGKPSSLIYNGQLIALNQAITNVR
ncbi:MAG: hypothetical protein K2L00_09960, partial [Muribaculaceae bacterium]|nr:hypothetical protein [Muribaculaceae bacterium]